MFWGGNAARRRRAVVAAVAGAVLGLAGAAPAFADDPAVARPRAGGNYGSVRIEGFDRPVGVGAMWMDFGTEQKPLAYCIDLHHPVALDADYREGSWDSSEVENLGKVQWVLLHGHPTADAQAVLAAAGADGGNIGAERLGQLLYVATQVSIWHFSDGAVLTGAARGLDEGEFALVKKVYDNLTANATDAPEPKAELSVGPASATAPAGAKAGPFTVAGPSGDIALTADGGTAVDESGSPVTTVTNGSTFWLVREGAGDVSATVRAESTHSAGRVFLFTGTAARQKLILAGTVGDRLEAGVKASFAPVPESSPSSPSASPSTPATPSVNPSVSPSPSAPATPSASPSTPAPGTGGGGDLPLTGASTYAVIGAGVLLLIGGMVAVLVVRRRRVSFTA